MASSKGYLDYVLEQLSGLDGITYRQMMGEYIIYYQGRIAGGIYDDRFLVKDTPAARKLIPDAVYEIPYDKAKPMILVEELDDSAFLCSLLDAMLKDLPLPKKKKTDNFRSVK